MSLSVGACPRPPLRLLAACLGAGRQQGGNGNIVLWGVGGVINTLRREMATAAAPAATTTTTTTNTSTATKTAKANKATTPTSRAALSSSWRDGTPTGAPGTPRRSKLQLHPGAPPPLLPSPRACGLGPAVASGARSAPTGVSVGRGISPSTPSPPRSLSGRGKTTRWQPQHRFVGGGGRLRGIPPPPRASLGGVTYASTTRSAAQGSRPGAVRVVAAAGGAKAAPLLIQPTGAAL